MATERLPMRQIREILRLRRQQELSVRETARALGVSVVTAASNPSGLRRRSVAKLGHAESVHVRAA
jgi:transcriptional regulator with XRE-family HTH domain